MRTCHKLQPIQITFVIFTEIGFGDPCIELGPSDQCITNGAVCTDSVCNCLGTDFRYQLNETCIKRTLQCIPFTTFYVCVLLTK